MEKAILRVRLGVLAGVDFVWDPITRELLLVVVERGVVQHRAVMALEPDQVRQVHAFLDSILKAPIALPGDVTPPE